MEHFHLILNFYYETFFSNFHSILFKFQLIKRNQEKKNNKRKKIIQQKVDR